MAVGYYYCPHSGRLRWILVPDHESEIQLNNTGEHLLIVSRTDYEAAARIGPAAHQALVNAHTSKAPGDDDRHVKIHAATGAVIAVMYAHPCCGDPIIDPDGHFLIKHATAAYSWSFRQSKLLPS
jgi:hypothetical protein